MLISWLHLLALAVFLGAVLGLWILVLSPLSTISSYNDRLVFLIKSLKVYNPLQIGALGVLLMTGAFQITELKQSYGAGFANALAAILGLKLALAFVVIITSTYQSMGLAHRFVRQTEQPEPIPEQKFNSTIRRLRVSSIIILVLTLVTILVGIRI